MARVQLKYYRAKAKGKFYYYPWRPITGESTPRLPGEPGSPEFNAALIEAHENRRVTNDGRFRSLVVRFKASAEFREFAESTRKNWGPWLDRISDHFGALRIAQFDRPDKIRKIIRKWRGKWSATPRTADYGIQVLSRVLTYGVDLGELAQNPCDGIGYLYDGDRSDIIWTDSEISLLKQFLSDEQAHVVDLAALTGLRLGDLVRLSWSHISEDAIAITTGKSKYKREALIPLYDDLRALLKRIPKRATTVLTHSRGRPWTTSGIESAIDRAKSSAKIGDRHFHDLRGTAATKFYVADISIRVIAEIMAWDEARVEKIIKKYVGRAAATKALILQINKGRT
jgi:integrase